MANFDKRFLSNTVEWPTPQELYLPLHEVRFVRGRPKFGDADHGLPLPLAVVIYRPRYGAAVVKPNA